jgi:hypothetical protein
MQEKKYLIYGLEDPRTKEIRYIGRSSNGLERPKSHITESSLKRYNTKVYTWIKSLKKINLIPNIIIIQSWNNISNEDLNSHEIYWIDYYKKLNYKLTNMTNGGDGTYGRVLTDSHKKAIIESNKKRKYSKKTLEKMSNSAKNRKIHKPKKIIEASNGLIFYGYKELSEFLGCKPENACIIVKKNKIKNKLTFKIIGEQPNGRRT